VDVPKIKEPQTCMASLIKTKYLLPGIILISITLRLIPIRFKYFLGYDTYFHAAYIEYSTALGKWVNFFPYANAPWGMLIDQFHPKGFWMLPYYIYKLLSPIGVSIDETFRMTPVVVGTATIILVYFAIKNMYSNTEATLSALFMAVSFGHIFRSMANYYRGDNYLLLWYSLALLGIGLALSPKFREKLGFRVLVFYLIPGLAAGLSAGFWSAYYLIFVFLLINAAFLAIGGLLLSKPRVFIDSLGLTLSAALGALVANFLGSRLGYGMFGWNRPDGVAAAEKLGLEFGLVKDAFLITYLKYTIPLMVLLIAILQAGSHILKDNRHRTTLVAIILLAGVLVGIHYENLIKSVFLVFLRRFGDKAIAETQKTSLRDAWISYGTLLLAIPLFALRIRPSRIKIPDFIILSFAIPEIIMITLWTRFLFIGSLAVAVLAGVGTVELMNLLMKKNTKNRRYIAMAIVLLLIIPTGIIGLQNTLNIRPIVNENWAKALTYLGETSNVNDVILTWWDQGYWVTYFSQRGTPSRGVPDKFIAKYYLGMVNTDELMNLGVDYVIVSYDTILKFPAIVETAGVSLKCYSIIIIPFWEQSGKSFIFGKNGYYILANPENGYWDIVINTNGIMFSPKKAFIENNQGVREVNIRGIQKTDTYVYINLKYGYAVLMNEKVFNTTLAKLMFTEKLPNYQLVYSDGGYVKIFKFEHPNVAVKYKGGDVVFEFTNATGKYLIITGFLDNGTVVFNERYNVGGMNRFTLPTQLNGSVVIRYTYERNGKVLDRGIVRVDDYG